MKTTCKERLFSSALSVVLFVSQGAWAVEAFSEAESVVLPEDMRVYVRGNVVLNYPVEGFDEVVLPTRNDFTGVPGGYIACYSKIETKSAYGVGGGIYVMGQIRTKGHYQGRIFQPEGFKNKDISAAEKFKSMCNKSFAFCKNSCWAGGDTGGWFGIPDK